MTQTSPRELRHQRTHDAILDAARRILYEKGIDGLSMRAIAQRIEYSAAGLYEYFGSKEEIIEAVCEQGFARLTMQLRAVDPALPPLAALEAQGRNYLRFAQDNTDFYLLMFTSAPLSGLLAKEMHAGPEEMLRQSPAFMALYEAVDRCAREGILPTSPQQSVFAMAMMLWQLVHGTAMLAISMGGGQFGMAYGEPAMRALVRGFQAGQVR